MGAVLSILLLLIPLGLAVRHIKQGIWGGVILLVNVTTAALLATNYFESLAGVMQGIWEGGYYWYDIIALWVIFTLMLLLTTLVTNKLSGFRVKFPSTVDQVGGVVLNVWAGWVLVCFTLATLHTAPLAKHFFFGAFQPEQQMVFGLAPDRLWLGFTQKLSDGAYSAGNTFDPDGSFMLRYMAKRAKFEKESGLFNPPPAKKKA